MTHFDTSTHTFLGTAVACGVIKQHCWPPCLATKMHTTPPHSSTTKRRKKNQHVPALLHHYCFSSLIVKVKRTMEVKLEVSPLVPRVETGLLEEKEVCVGAANGGISSLSNTLCFMPWWLSLSFIHLSNTHTHT